MSVYVDDAIWPFGRMMMCHMMADTLEELHSMAARIGMLRSWFQDKPGKTPHYDLSKTKRSIAVAMGAVEVNRYGSSAISTAWRRARAADSIADTIPSFPLPKAASEWSALMTEWKEKV